MRTIPRRALLRTLAGAAIPLPFLDAMARPARAATAPSRLGRNGRPKRFIVLFTGSGQGADWFNNSVAPDGSLVLSQCLSPMERHKNDLILIDGLNMRTAMMDKSLMDPGHAKPSAHMLTCAPVTPDERISSISIDQAIAAQIGGDTKFRSLQFGVQTGGTFSNGPGGVSLPAVSDPAIMFGKLFADLRADPAALDKARAKRVSILDGVQQEYATLVAAVSGDDRRKLSTHLDAVRELEKRVSNLTIPAAATCSAPAKPAGNPGMSSPEYVTVGRAHLDLLVMALACDLTRVASVAFRGPANGVAIPEIMVDNLHTTSHTDPPGRNRASRWHADYFATFFDALKRVKDGDGSVFDNSLIYWTTEHGAGDHNYDRMTVLVAGSAGGALKTGQRIVLSGTPCGKNCVDGPGHGDLFVSFLNAMGVPATTFGQPDYCKGPLPGLAA